jgi:predicted RNase H-like HicB family nuclease
MNIKLRFGYALRCRAWRRSLSAPLYWVWNLSIELDREDDGRWIAEALELPGVMTYSSTREEAISNTERLAIEVIADRIAHDGLPLQAINCK